MYFLTTYPVGPEGPIITYSPTTRSPPELTFTPDDPAHFIRSVKGNRTVYIPPSGPGFYLGVSEGRVWVTWTGLVGGEARTPFDVTFTNVLKSL